jgi:hypothetical protein
MAFFGGGIVFPSFGRDQILQRYVAARPPENQDAEANIRWGKKSTWQFKRSPSTEQPTDIALVEGSTTGDRRPALAPTVTYPEEEPETPDDTSEKIVVDFIEVARDVEEVRVENPEDSDQYVIVENTTVILFKGPDLRPPDLIGKEGRQQAIYYRYTFESQDDEEAI